MEEKKEFLYYIELKEENGKLARYPVYKSSKSYYIGGHPVEAGKSLENEIKDFFNAEVIGPAQEHIIHQELKFKDIK